MEGESFVQTASLQASTVRKKTLIKTLLGFSIFLCVLSLRASTENAADSLTLSPANANYVMQVRLEPESRMISGSAILTWRNITSFPAPDLRFHMYFNAWLNTQSSFLNSVRHSNYNFSDFKESDWAFVHIDSMQVLPSTNRTHQDVTNALRYIQPDDGNPADKTVLQLPLDRPVLPGDTIQIEFQFRTKVPKTFRRVGARSDYFFLAHWFPKIGVFEPNGQWNCRQYIQTEYYADFGVYDVSITTPEGWVVGATGREIATDSLDSGEITHQFFQRDVHEFAWTASPHFSVHEKRFEHPVLPSVDMRLLLMPDHASKKERYFAATEAALEYYGLWAGAYPYGHVTIVDPAYRSRTGGMEYPTFFTGGTRWLSPLEARSPEGVTVHEAGHQFWYGLVANNEFEHAWLDEGFNTYFTTRTMQAAYPNPVYTKRYFHGFLPVVTIVDPAYRSRTGGMEYPTFFTGGTRWLSPLEARSPEGVTVHEAGHQFWYGLVANNEFEHAWLDEGFNTYFTTRTMQAAYPNPVYTKRYFHGFLPVVFPSVNMPERTDGADAYDGLRSAWKRDPMSADSWRHGPGSYGLNSYTKPALILRTLENYFGWERFHQVLTTYFERWRFKHPKPEDFFAIVTEITGEDMAWYFDQVWDNTVVFDYAVGAVNNKAVQPARGYSADNSEFVFEEGREADSTAQQLFRSSAIIRRWGEGIFPVDVRITFSNGETTYEQWDGRDRWTRFSYTKSGRIETVEVDPNHYLTLDVNYANNSWTRRPQARRAATKWGAKWMFWLQNVLEFFAFFG